MTYAAWAATVGASTGEQRVRIRFDDADPIAYSLLGDYLASDGPTMVDGVGLHPRELDDESDSSYAHFTEAMFVDTGDNHTRVSVTGVRCHLPAVSPSIPTDATDVRLTVGVRARHDVTKRRLRSFDAGLSPEGHETDNIALGDEYILNLVQVLPQDVPTAAGLPWGEWTVANTIPAFTSDQVARLNAGTYYMDVMAEMVGTFTYPTIPALTWDLAEVYLLLRYQPASAGPLPRTPLRGRQRNSGTTASVPLRGRNQQPYGLRGRQNADL